MWPWFLTPVILSLPTRLDHAGNFTGQGKLPETDPAQIKFAKIAARTPASKTAIPLPAFEFQLLQSLCDLGCSCHVFLVFLEFLNPFPDSYCLNGIPICFNSAKPSASVLAVVVIEMFIPLAFSTL